MSSVFEPWTSSTIQHQTHSKLTELKFSGSQTSNFFLSSCLRSLSASHYFSAVLNAVVEEMFLFLNSVRKNLAWNTWGKNNVKFPLKTRPGLCYIFLSVKQSSCVKKCRLCDMVAWHKRRHCYYGKSAFIPDVICGTLSFYLVKK